ncbi:hypothetical protein L1887_24632 [Cichorium endivia]|nr:hypothetical protein L1887_24632 [Cichorium endivia]
MLFASRRHKGLYAEELRGALKLWMDKEFNNIPPPGVPIEAYTLVRTTVHGLTYEDENGKMCFMRTTDLKKASTEHLFNLRLEWYKAKSAEGFHMLISHELGKREPQLHAPDLVIIEKDLYFNEVQMESEKFGSVFHASGATAFNNFIATTGLVEVPLGGYDFTWVHGSAGKISKLDRFLVSEGLYENFPNLNLEDFQLIVHESWINDGIDTQNAMIRLKNKLKVLKDPLKFWAKENNRKRMGDSVELKASLAELDEKIDKGDLSVVDIRNAKYQSFLDIERMEVADVAQKAKLKWAIEGDENTKYFHGIVNKNRSRSAIRGVFADGEWIDNPTHVIKEFLDHFASRFSRPSEFRVPFNHAFPRQLSEEQGMEVEGLFRKNK